MKKNLLLTVLLAVFLLPAMSLIAQNYFEDTVWTNKTDQASGFYQVKFSNNDSIIVGHGNGMSQQPDTKFCLFYDSNTGEEINRIPGNREVFFFNNDLNFIKLNDERNVFEIFDTRTFQIIDTLENDGTKLYPPYTLTNDESKLVGVKSGGLRTWDMETKRILNSKDFPSFEGLTSIKVHQIFPNCNDNEIILNVEKVYLIKESPPEYQSIVRNIFYDINTLDSVNTFRYNPFRISHNCNYFAVMTPKTTYGVEMYDFNTKQLLHKLPVNGPSLTGIEFSPDDKYVVTSNGPGQNSLIVWDVMTGAEHYKYTETSFSNFDISNDGKNLVFSVKTRLKMLRTKFGNTSNQDNVEMPSLLYPNPATGEVNIDLSNHTLKDVVESIRVYDVLGMEHPATAWHPSAEGNVRIDVSSLSPGVYFVRVGGKVLKFMKI